jgi:hypothetical protein
VAGSGGGIKPEMKDTDQTPPPARCTWRRPDFDRAHHKQPGLNFKGHTYTTHTGRSPRLNSIRGSVSARTMTLPRQPRGLDRVLLRHLRRAHRGSQQSPAAARCAHRNPSVSNPPGPRVAADRRHRGRQGFAQSTRRTLVPLADPHHDGSRHRARDRAPSRPPCAIRFADRGRFRAPARSSQWTLDDVPNPAPHSSPSRLPDSLSSPCHGVQVYCCAVRWNHPQRQVRQCGS